MTLKFNQSSTKTQQLADYLQKAISENDIKVGEKLPSINDLSKKHHVSRDTVFKSLLILKEKGLIDSMQGKSYFVASHTTEVFLMLDEYSQFKESLYRSLRNKLPLSYKIDLWFHNYNENLFNTIINEEKGKHSKYIVMNYHNEKFSNILSEIDKKKLLLLDFGKFGKRGYSYICQDFDESFYNVLSSVKDRLSNYEKLIFVFNKSHKHPKSSIDYFIKFCEDNLFPYEIMDGFSEEDSISQKHLYIVIKQSDVVNLVKRSRFGGMKMGKDFGLIAYNDNPFYEIIGDGISTISIDFNVMGSLAADFVLTGNKIQTFIPTKINIRNSF